jgi:hypothetical protein
VDSITFYLVQTRKQMDMHMAYTHMHTHTQARVRTHTHTHTDTHAHARTHTHMHTRTTTTTVAAAPHPDDLVQVHRRHRLAHALVQHPALDGLAQRAQVAQLPRRGRVWHHSTTNAANHGWHRRQFSAAGVAPAKEHAGASGRFAGAPDGYRFAVPRLPHLHDDHVADRQAGVLPWLCRPVMRQRSRTRLCGGAAWVRWQRGVQHQGGCKGHGCTPPGIKAESPGWAGRRAAGVWGTNTWKPHKSIRADHPIAQPPL